MDRLEEESDSHPVTPVEAEGRPYKDPPPVKERPPLERLPTYERYTEEEKKSMSRRCCTLAELKARPEIFLWYFGNMLSYLGFFMPFLNLAYYMELKGIPPAKSSWALTLLSFAECVTYIIASFMGDYFKGRLVYVNIIAAAALSFICLIWPLVDVSYAIICLISMAMGGFLGLTIVYTYAASGEVTRLPIDIAWSFTNLWCGFGILCGPFFSGFIYDFRKSYDDVFYVVGVLYFLDVFIFAGIPGMAWWRKKHAQQTAYTDALNSQNGQNETQTYRIRGSGSQSSLVNGDQPDRSTLQQEYGTTGYTSVNPTQGYTEQPPPDGVSRPQRPPPPPQDVLQRQGSRNSFTGGYSGGQNGYAQ